MDANSSQKDVNPVNCCTCEKKSPSKHSRATKASETEAQGSQTLCQKCGGEQKATLPAKHHWWMPHSYYKHQYKPTTAGKPAKANSCQPKAAKIGAKLAAPETASQPTGVKKAGESAAVNSAKRNRLRWSGVWWTPQLGSETTCADPSGIELAKQWAWPTQSSEASAVSLGAGDPVEWSWPTNYKDS